MLVLAGSALTADLSPGLLLSSNSETVTEAQAETCDNGVVLDGPAYYHDGVMQRPLSLFYELLCATTQHNCARLSLDTASEDVVPAIDTRNTLANKQPTG